MAVPIVLDFNVVFSALVSKGIAYKVFTANAELNVLEFIAPQLIFSELIERKDKILSLSRLSQPEREEISSLILRQIKIISETEFMDKFEEAAKLNRKDSLYLALALKFDCAIFSGDKELKTKQSSVVILSPRMLLDSLV